MTASQPQLRPIPLAQPSIGDEEIDLVNRVLRSDVLAMGPYTEAFEVAVAELAGEELNETELLAAMAHGAHDSREYGHG